MPIPADDYYTARAGQVIRAGWALPANEPPVWSAIPDPLQITRGSTVDLKQYVTDPEGDALTFALESGTLPTGVTFANGIFTAAADATLGESGDLVVSADDGYVEDPPPPEPGALPTFGLTSATGGSDLPFTFGHVFAQGDVPSGSYVTSDLAEFEAAPRNYWGDGSLKFAVLKGRATLTAGVKRDIVLSATSTVPSGSNVASVTAGEVGATTVVHSVAGTVSLADAINGADLSVFSGTVGTRPASAGKLRSIPGRLMTEEHFYAPFPSDGHLCVFWYVRKYLGGRIEIETSVEQGWARIAGPAQLDGTVTVTVNGAQTYTAALEHRHHNRWSRTDWIGGDPQITPTIDGMYWRKTRMVPNYMPEQPSGTRLDALVQSAAPMTRGPFAVGAAGGGYHEHLGILPLWDSMVVTSNCDKRAYLAMLTAEQASNCCSLGPSSAGFVWRDEKTLQPISIPDFYNDSLSNMSAPTYPNAVYGGTTTTSYPWGTDQAHGWAAGYMAYLVTGRWFSLETVQMNAGAEHLTWGASDGSAYGRSQRWMNAEDRSAAWGFRSLANVLATAPATIADQAAYRSAIKTHIEAGLGWWVSRCVGNNTLGIMSRGDHPYGVTGGYDDTGAFMQYFASQCFAFANDIIGSGDLGSTATTNLHDSAMFHAKLPVGLAGTVPDGHCYRNAAAYNLPVQTKSGSVYTWLADFAAVYAARVERGEIAAGDACSDGSTLTGGNFPESGSYWGNYLPALAYAVDLGAPGAAAAWARVTGASNYETLRAGFADSAPQFGIVPR